MTDLDDLERRVHALELEAEKSREFRAEYYKNLQDRIVFETQMRDSIESIGEKIDRLIEWQDNQIAKPGKRLDSIWDKIVLTLIGAVVGAIVGRWFG